MKNIMKIMMLLLLAVGLAACSDQADVEPGTKEKKSEMTLEEVFSKAAEASKEVKSISMDMDMKQKMKMESAGVDMATVMKSTVEMIHEPLAMHQVMQIEMPDAQGGTMETEMYMNDTGIYMFEPLESTWMKLPMESLEEIQSAMGVSTDVSVDYSSLQEYINDFKFTQNDNEYILELTGAGDSFKKLIENELESTGMIDGMEEAAEMVESMKIHNLEYKIHIDKKTFQTTAFTLITSLEMGVEGEVIQIEQDVNSKINSINEVKEIVIPDEVLDAVEL